MLASCVYLLCLFLGDVRGVHGEQESSKASCLRAVDLSVCLHVCLSACMSVLRCVLSIEVAF